MPRPPVDPDRALSDEAEIRVLRPAELESLKGGAQQGPEATPRPATLDSPAAPTKI